MSKVDTDIFLMSSFSKEHKAIEKEMRSKNLTNVCSENLIKFKISPKQFEEDSEFIEKFNKELAKCGLEAWKDERARKQLEKDGKNKKSRGEQYISKQQERTDYVETHSMSGLWQMLEKQSVENGFPITEMGYNVYDDKRLDWLKREDLQWEDREEIKDKCMKWIKKCNL